MAANGVSSDREREDGKVDDEITDWDASGPMLPGALDAKKGEERGDEESGGVGKGSGEGKEVGGEEKKAERSTNIPPESCTDRIHRGCLWCDSLGCCLCCRVVGRGCDNLTGGWLKLQLLPDELRVVLVISVLIELLCVIAALIAVRIVFWPAPHATDESINAAMQTLLVFVGLSMAGPTILGIVFVHLTGVRAAWYRVRTALLLGVVWSRSLVILMLAGAGVQLMFTISLSAVVATAREGCRAARDLKCDRWSMRNFLETFLPEVSFGILLNLGIAGLSELLARTMMTARSTKSIDWNRAHDADAAENDTERETASRRDSIIKRLAAGPSRIARQRARERQREKRHEHSSPNLKEKRSLVMERAALTRRGGSFVEVQESIRDQKYRSILNPDESDEEEKPKLQSVKDEEEEEEEEEEVVRVDDEDVDDGRGALFGWSSSSSSKKK